MATGFNAGTEDIIEILNPHILNDINCIALLVLY